MTTTATQMTQQDKNRIENAIWVLQQYRYTLEELYTADELNPHIDLHDTFWDLDEIKKYMEENQQ